MVNIIEKLENFIGEATKFKSEINQLLTTFDGKVEQVSKNRDNLLTIKEDLDSRQADIEKIENLVTLASEAKKLAKDASEKMSELSKSKDAFENYKNGKVKELGRLESDLTEKGKYIKAEYEALNKEKDLLAKDKATYKDKIASSIVNLANKK